ncbi:phage tail protein [Mycolicibacterium litorale]|uniref:ARB-07466-like C-terminal domain-containing protein n=1 Tax=Mycolicibacterium litorale TaxID=758802 RepID=A0AAD1IQ40_9MYCO|nr:hypothetical protein [Mycolicibacterium litorale]MCV7417794.1 hypothetical protein [Mycolicibacterium litorale]TDY06817.1 phage-related protein [Mycolicibacterium litorale]BBY19026.1 hypothetical protein MLIT_46180 [Mycolicibacterium litorale]
MASIADIFVSVIPETSRVASGVREVFRDIDREAYQAGQRWGREMERGMGRPRIGADTRPGERDVDEFKRKVDKTRASVKVDVDKSGFDAAATSLRNLSTNYKAVGLASAAIASPTAIAGTVSVVSQLSGVLGLIPAAAGAAGLAIGSLKVATAGFSDAVKEVRDPEKFAEAIGKLSPNAQQAATAIQGMLPALDQLKFTVQDAFFAGFGQQLQQLSSSYLPMFQTTMSKIAASANSAMTEVSQQLQTPAMQGDIATMGGVMAVAFDKLSGALAPIVSSFVDIGLVGSGFLPQLADGAARAAEAFSQFVGEARASGDMQAWIEGGIAGFKQLGDIIGNIGGILGGFASAAPEGGGPLGMLQSLTQVANDFVNSPAGQGALTSWMTALRDTMSALAPAAGAFLQAIAPIGGIVGTALVTTVEAIAPALTSWFNAMQPVVQQLSGALTPVVQALGPVLEQMASVLAGQMVSGIQTILPVLIPFVQQWGQALTSIMPLLPSLLQLAMSALPMVQQAVAVILPPMTQWMSLMANLGNLVIPPLNAAITTMSTVWQASFGTMQNVVSTAWNVMQPVFNAIKTAIDGLLGPLDEIIGLASRLPGVQSAIGTIKGVAGAATTPGAIPGATTIPGLPAASTKPAGTYRTRDGQIRTIPRGTAPIAPIAGVPTTQLPIPPVSTYVAPVTSSGGGSGSSTASKPQFSDANLVPNAARLNDLIAEQFPQIREIGGYRANGGGSNDHPSGRALDIMIPDWDTPEGKALGDQINQWLHQNSDQLGIDSTIWQDFWAPVTGGGKRLGRQGANEGHYNHIHAKVSDKPASGTYTSPLSATYPDTTEYTAYDPMGSTYDTTGDKSLRDAQQKVDDKSFAIEQAQRKLDELPGDASGSQRAQRERALANAKREHADALEDLAAAQGKYNEKAAADPSAKGGNSDFKSLGSDLVSGMFEVLGIGDIFKDPTQFGLFKIAKAVMGLDINTGAAGGEGSGMFPGGGGGGGGLTSLLSNIPGAMGALNIAGSPDAPTPFMPSMPQAGGGGVVLPGNMMASPFSPTGANSAAGPGNQPQIDQSVTINGARFGYSQTQVQDQIRNTHLSQARVPLRTLPTQ